MIILLKTIITKNCKDSQPDYDWNKNLKANLNYDFINFNKNNEKSTVSTNNTNNYKNLKFTDPEKNLNLIKTRSKSNFLKNLK